MPLDRNHLRSWLAYAARAFGVFSMGAVYSGSGDSVVMQRQR